MLKEKIGNDCGVHILAIKFASLYGFISGQPSYNHIIFSAPGHRYTVTYSQSFRKKGRLIFEMGSGLLQLHTVPTETCANAWLT